MLDHLFLTYGSITAVDLEHNVEDMRNAWDPQQPVDTLFKQIQHCVDYTEAGGFIICPAHQIDVVYTKIFAPGSLISACCRCNEKEAACKSWTKFKIHFATTHRQHKQTQGESAAIFG
jgi:hypothetical protein